MPRSKQLPSSVFRAGRIWWDLDKFEYETGFVREIDSELAGSEPQDFERVFRRMLDSIRRLDSSS